jgi:CRISPR-associated endonuclease Cas1
MTATQTVSQFPSVRKSAINKSGVLTLSGFNVRVRMRGGHLEIEDGVGLERRNFKLPRVGHGVKRLVIVGNDGYVSLGALQWLAVQEASLTFLDRKGKVLFITGPVRPSDARLRRAQALAEYSGAALNIARELISRKLAGQGRVLREKLLDSTTADSIERIRVEVEQAETVAAIRSLEAQAAATYWAVWRDLPICFPKNDLRRVPEHWRAYDTRKSLLSGAQRLATNPANAILNYLYAILESEARLAAAALGLDPGLGFIHMDAPARDSLACDLMESVRPDVDSYVIDLVTRQLLKREWFVEQPDGNCRITAPLAAYLGETAPMWARAIAPVAEWVARQLWTRRRDSREIGPATRLTQSRKREAKGAPSLPQAEHVVRPPSLCCDCGKEVGARATRCAKCFAVVPRVGFAQVAELGRVVAHMPEAQAKRGATQKKQRQAERAWMPSAQPDWLTAKFYRDKIQPGLATLGNSAIARHLGVTECYARRIRQGHSPHPRHWQALAQLVGVSPGT